MTSFHLENDPRVKFRHNHLTGLQKFCNNPKVVAKLAKLVKVMKNNDSAEKEKEGIIELLRQKLKKLFI